MARYCQHKHAKRIIKHFGLVCFHYLPNIAKKLYLNVFAITNIVEYIPYDSLQQKSLGLVKFLYRRLGELLYSHSRLPKYPYKRFPAKTFKASLEERGYP